MIIKIFKGKCKIEPIPTEALAITLEKEFSYKKQGSEFMPNPHWAIVKLYKIKTGIFPLGFLNKVIGIIKQWNDYKKIDDNIELINLNTHNGSKIKLADTETKLRPYQTQAVETFLDHKRGIIALATGLGKTLTAINIIKAISVRTLIIVHTTELLKQWYNVIQKELSYDSGLLCGSKKEVKDITIASIQTLYNRKEIIKDFDFIIIDESHHISADMIYKTGLEFTQEYVLGLTATPYRSDGNDMKIHAIAGDIIYQKNIKWGIDNGYLCPAEVKWLDIQDDIKVARFDKYPDIYNNKIVFNDKRNEAIINTAKDHQGKILILVSRIEHGDILLEMLQGLDVIFIQGKTKDKDTNHRIIIATSIFDEGLDIPDISGVILAGGGKSSITTVQRMGRGLRIYPGKEKLIIYDFIESCKYLVKHYLERKAIYERELE